MLDHKYFICMHYYLLFNCKYRFLLPVNTIFYTMFKIQTQTRNQCKANTVVFTTCIQPA